jgi:hypothetical protein
MTILRWCENNTDQIRTIVQALFLTIVQIVR